MSGEKAGRREAIDRMTRQIIDNSRAQVTPEQARKTATDAAIRKDRREEK
jgi:hypothetical protein